MNDSRYYPISPCPKPRQTRRDKWLNPPRVPVSNYRAFSDLVRLHNVALPECGAHVIFHVPMAESWSKRKKAEMNGKPHQLRGDADNFLKALMDSIYKDDSVVWDIRVTKLWALTGSIEIRGAG